MTCSFHTHESDGRNTLTGGVPEVVNRSLAIKITRLLRY